jgi:hypothetical protein
VRIIRAVGRVAGHPCIPRTHPLSSLGIPSRMSDAHLGDPCSGVGRIWMLTNARTSEYLWPGQDPTMKIDHNVNRRPLEHSSAEENA